MKKNNLKASSALLLALLQAASLVYSAPAPTEVIQVPIAAGPCEPTWKSLGDHFQTPQNY